MQKARKHWGSRGRMPDLHQIIQSVIASACASGSKRPLLCSHLWNFWLASSNRITVPGLSIGDAERTPVRRRASSETLRGHGGCVQLESHHLSPTGPRPLDKGRRLRLSTLMRPSKQMKIGSAPQEQVSRWPVLQRYLVTAHGGLQAYHISDALVRKKPRFEMLKRALARLG